MQLSKYSLLVTLSKIIEKSGDYWSKASIKGYRKLLKQYHGVDIQKRQLCYHMADLRAEGLIHSIQRTGRDEAGRVYRKTSATCLTLKGCTLLAKKGMRWALRHYNRLRKKFAGQPETPRPTDAPRTGAPTPLSDIFKDPSKVPI